MSRIVDELCEVEFSALNLEEARRLAKLIGIQQLESPTPGQAAISAWLDRIELPYGVTIENVGLLMGFWKNEEYYVSINFKLSDVHADSSRAFMKSLHDFANETARHASHTVYYAGLDPASDEDTRFFTGLEYGPCYGAPWLG